MVPAAMLQSDATIQSPASCRFDLRNRPEFIPLGFSSKLHFCCARTHRDPEPVTHIGTTRLYYWIWGERSERDSPDRATDTIQPRAAELFWGSTLV